LRSTERMDVPRKPLTRLPITDRESADDAQSKGRRSSRRSAIDKAVKIAFGMAVLAYGGVFVASRWSELSDAVVQATPGWIAAAFLFAMLGQWAGGLGFRAALAASSRWLPVVDVARVFFVSQLGKYIPGSVWPIVAVTEMCRKYGITRRAAAIGGLLAMLFSTVIGGLLGIVLVLVGASSGAAGVWWLVLLIPVAFAAVHPRVVVPTINWMLRMARRAPVAVDLTGAALRGALGWPVVSWLFLGLQCWALVVALGGPALPSLAASIGGFALAYAAGTLFVPAPAGAGVREAVLGVALVNIIDSSSFGHDKVIVVVLLSRVMLAILDFAQAGTAVLVARFRHLAPAK
jgi:glycosyltransferase 2 family protein